MESFFSSRTAIHLHITQESLSQAYLGKNSASPKVNSLKKNVQFKCGCVIRICTSFHSHVITRENTYSIRESTDLITKLRCHLKKKKQILRVTKTTYEHRPPWTSVYTSSTILKYSINNPPQNENYTI